MAYGARHNSFRYWLQQVGLLRVPVDFRPWNMKWKYRRSDKRQRRQAQNLVLRLRQIADGLERTL